MSISENLRIVRSKIDQASKRAGREASSVKLVAATKDVPINLIEEAIKAGITDIGENRIQEAKAKYDTLKQYPVTWHMIGHLQTNKVREAVKMFNVIESVDSEKLAKEISDKSAGQMEVFMEVNTSGEESKFGIDPEAAINLARFISTQPNLKLSGLMTIGPNTGIESDIRKSFKFLVSLKDQIKELNLPGLELKYLSMGMSDDFEIAIEEGSNLVRIGRAIFGKRK